MSLATKYLIAALLLMNGLFAATVATSKADDKTKRRSLDPAEWGDDHVGKPFPAYVTGDECLFCHRKTGANWGENRHQLTVRLAAADDPALTILRQLTGGNESAADSQFLLGSQRITRFLRRSSEYGKLEILSTTYIPKRDRGDVKKSEGIIKVGKLNHTNKPHWDQDSFADRCAGCHTTAVNSRSRAFSAVSIDCFSCHGDVDLDHSKDISLVLLSKKNRVPRQIVSICGQCHLRGGRSKTSGLPYPNTFVAGDNLFRDFQVDFLDEAIDLLSPIDQHIWINVRDVALYGLETTCLTCHEVHRQGTEKHQRLDDAAVCSACHTPGKDKSMLRDALQPLHKVQTRNRVCDY